MLRLQNKFACFPLFCLLIAIINQNDDSTLIKAKYLTQMSVYDSPMLYVILATLQTSTDGMVLFL